MQFWRIGNIGATALLKLRVESMPLYILATMATRYRGRAR